MFSLALNYSLVQEHKWDELKKLMDIEVLEQTVFRQSKTAGAIAKKCLPDKGVLISFQDVHARANENLKVIREDRMSANHDC